MLKKKHFIFFVIIFAVAFLFGWLIRTLVWMDKGLVSNVWRAILPW